MSEIIICICGILCGWFLGFIINRITAVYGILRVDTLNPNTDVYSLEIDNLDDLTKKKQVILKVEHSRK